MGLAAVPFGMAQAEDYEIKVKDWNGGPWISACCRKKEVISEYSDYYLSFCGNFGVNYESFNTKDLPSMYDGSYRVLRGYHDENGGKVCVMDMKFSEGKTVTRKDVEGQWQREEVLIRDAWKRREPWKRFTVNCKIYNLPKGCAVMHFVLVKERFLNFFLVKDGQRSFGGTEHVLVVVVPDGCETVKVESEGIPTIVCGNKVDGLISSHEILDPSVRSSLLFALGQKELSVNHYAAVRGCETDTPEVLLKDCPFVQQTKAIGQMRSGSKESSVVGVWKRFPCGKFRLDLSMTGCVETDGSFIGLEHGVYSVFAGIRWEMERFSKFLHRGAKHNAVRHIKALAEDNTVRCIEHLKEKLKKLEGKLEKVSEKEKLKK